MTERKTVNGIATKGLSDKEYMRLYRTRSTEECIKKANDMGKLDTDFYKKLVNVMKTDPKLRKLIVFIPVMVAFGSMSVFSVKIALTQILHIYM